MGPQVHTTSYVQTDNLSASQALPHLLILLSFIILIRTFVSNRRPSSYPHIVYLLLISDPPIPPLLEEPFSASQACAPVLCIKDHLRQTLAD